MSDYDKHIIRFLGGFGTTFLIYVWLRLAETSSSVIVFGIVFVLISYGLGWLIQREDKDYERHK